MIQLVRGFKDILPDEIEMWKHIERTAMVLFEDFGFRQIRLPLLEKTELFARSIGEHTDIVEKEMYTFPGSRDEMLTLRPEATASVVRSYIQQKLYAADPVRKLYTIGPMFRKERPQKGRYRQFYQINAEVFGIDSPYMDAQLIVMLTTFFAELSVAGLTVRVNSLGCPDCRPQFKEALTDFLAQRSAALCTDCVRRMSTNPMRVLDCKVPSCKEAIAGAPSMIDYLCGACAAHFETVKSALQNQKVDFTVDAKLVRGLDYYTRTAFEIQTDALGAQNAIAGGGRYDGLVEALGGPAQPAVGFAIGMDRLVDLMKLKQPAVPLCPELFIASLGEAAREKAFAWSCELGRAGVKTEIDFSDRSLKAMMKRADRVGAAYVLIAGDQELADGAVQLRDMATKAQTAIGLGEVVERVKAVIGSKV